MSLNEYEDHWITTCTGKKFHYLDPKQEEICIEDIAHALALTCRFGGHCKMFYSVAEHSIRVADIVDYKKLKLSALLHDAHEAYLHDVPRPIKHDMPQYKVMADAIQKVIMNKFSCQYNEVNQHIKYADDVMLATEAKTLLVNMNDWSTLPKPLKTFKPINWKNAERKFIKKFIEYSRI